MPRSPGRRSAVPLADLIDRAIEPACRKRGFAGADIVAWWPEIVGPAYAACTAPERVVWPRRVGEEEDFKPATLHVRVEGAMAVLFQHDLPQVIERINGYFGYPAIARIRLVQQPIPAAPEARERAPKPLSPESEQALRRDLDAITDPGLHDALLRLGRGVRSQMLAKT